MDNKTNWVLAILTFVLGAMLVLMYHVASPVVQEKIVFQEKLVTQNVTVDKIVETIVSVDSNNQTYNDAYAEYWAEVSDNRTLRSCDANRYDLDQISVKDYSDKEISVDDSNRRDTLTTVSFTAELKFTDKDTDEKCYRDDSVEVIFHSNQNKDPEISVA